jgi:hypothetical protein
MSVIAQSQTDRRLVLSLRVLWRVYPDGWILVVSVASRETKMGSSLAAFVPVPLL